MKRLFFAIVLFFTCNFCFAETYNLDWFVDGSTYTQTTCNAGDDIILPTAPTKRGYTFVGWANYIQIEYLKASGTQYIDTGIKVNSDYVVEVHGMFNCGQIPCGQEGNTFGSSFVLGIACSTGNSGWGNSGSNCTKTLLGVQPADIHTLKIDKYGVSTDGVRKISFTPPTNTVSATKNFLLFATKATRYGWSSDTIMYVKIWDENNALVRDFIPVLDSNYTPCMYDRVSGEFFYNAGTGNFIAGSAI